MYEWLLDFSVECSALSICFDLPFLQVSVSNELTGFDRKLWSRGRGGVGGRVRAMMKVS